MSKKELSSMEDLPETITKRNEGLIVRGVQDEERRAQEALSLIDARDRKIALLERKIVKLKNHAGGDSRCIFPKVSLDNMSLGNSSNKETTYLSIPATKATNSRTFGDGVKFERNCNFIEEITKLFGEKDDLLKKSIMSFKSIKHSETMSPPDLTTASTSSSNSEPEADILENVHSDFNQSSSLTSSEFCQDESSVNLVVTAALAFSKFDDVQCETNDCAKVSREKRAVNGNEDKKQLTEKSSKKNLVSSRLSTSLPGIKTRRLRKHRKRGFGRKVEKTLENDLFSRNREKAPTGIIESPQKMMHLSRAGRSETDLWRTASAVQKQRAEDKVAREDAQEAAPISDLVIKSKRKMTSSQNSQNLNDKFNNPMKAMSSSEPNNQFMGQKQFSGTWSTEDEPAPQWLIEEALKRGGERTENHQSANRDCIQIDDKENDSVSSKAENIINDLEKQLCTTRAELAQALNEQLEIKNKYKKALKDVKCAADEERDRLQQKIVQICTSIFEKFGPQALSRKTMKTCYKKYQRPLQHSGKLSKKLKIAQRSSSQLKQELVSTKKQLEEKSQQYDSMMKCFSSLKTELKSAESSMNDLLNENNLLRKKIEDTREWVYTRVNKERNEKINAAQFREIQRSRELANLKKKSEEDITTIAQLRGKLFRLESANANKGFLLNNYKGQLADLTKEKDSLSSKIKELEIDNSSLRTTNAQLRANLTLINEEKEKLSTDSEKSEMDVRDQMSMQSELATKCEQSMRQRIDTMRAEYDKTLEGMETKLNTSQNAIIEYREAIKRFLKKIDEYNEELDTERDLSCSEASEREAHETACEILNISPSELTGFLKGHFNNKINSWLSEVQKITAKKCFAENLGRFLFEKAISHTKR